MCVVFFDDGRLRLSRLMTQQQSIDKRPIKTLMNIKKKNCWNCCCWRFVMRAWKWENWVGGGNIWRLLWSWNIYGKYVQCTFERIYEFTSPPSHLMVVVSHWKSSRDGNIFTESMRLFLTLYWISFPAHITCHHHITYHLLVHVQIFSSRYLCKEMWIVIEISSDESWWWISSSVVFVSSLVYLLYSSTRLVCSSSSSHLNQPTLPFSNIWTSSCISSVCCLCLNCENRTKIYIHRIGMNKNRRRWKLFFLFHFLHMNLYFFLFLQDILLIFHFYKSMLPVFLFPFSCLKQWKRIVFFSYLNTRWELFCWIQFLSFVARIPVELEKLLEFLFHFFMLAI